MLTLWAHHIAMQSNLQTAGNSKVYQYWSRDLYFAIRPRMQHAAQGPLALAGVTVLANKNAQSKPRNAMYMFDRCRKAQRSLLLPQTDMEPHQENPCFAHGPGAWCVEGTPLGFVERETNGTTYSFWGAPILTPRYRRPKR